MVVLLWNESGQLLSVDTRALLPSCSCLALCSLPSVGLPAQREDLNKYARNRVPLLYPRNNRTSTYSLAGAQIGGGRVERSAFMSDTFDKPQSQMKTEQFHLLTVLQYLQISLLYPQIRMGLCSNCWAYQAAAYEANSIGATWRRRICGIRI